MRTNSNHAAFHAPVWSFSLVRRASFALVLLTISALAAVAYFTERGIVASRDWVVHTYRVRSQLSDLELEIMRGAADETNSVFMPKENEFPQLKLQSELVGDEVSQLRQLTRDNPRQQQRLVQLGELLKQDSFLKRRQNQRLSTLDEFRMQETIANRNRKIESIIKSMQGEEETLLEQRLKDWDYLFKRNVLMLGLAFAIVALLLAYNFRALVREVLQTKDAEKRVRDNAESYRLMSARILELRDLERRRVARELHDSVGQYLAGLKINLSQMGPGGSKLLRETLDLTDCAIQEVRTLSHLLHPPLLEELGFLPAARWYVDGYGKRSQVKVSLLVDEPIERLPREVEIALFRVLQESLTNVYRHAAARRVDVRIWCSGGHVHLTVADDGTGIPAAVLASFRRGAAQGIGLAGMRERLAEFGGTLNVESSSGGAVVEAAIPTSACRPSEESVDLLGA